MLMFCRSLFVLFLLAIVLSVLLRFMDYDYSFGIFTLLFSLGYRIHTFQILHTKYNCNRLRQVNYARINESIMMA